MEKNQITINEFRSRCDRFNIQTASLRDDSPRGYRTVSSDEVKVGDEVILDNYFTLVTAGSEVVNKNGTTIDFDAAFALMDDELVEEIHRLTPRNPQEFFSAYEAAHEEYFGEEWELSKANPVW